MPLEDYSHHNEEAQRIWWEEEGKHEAENIHDQEEFDREYFNCPCDIDGEDCCC